MKIAEAKRKIRKAQALLSEYYQINAILRTEDKGPKGWKLDPVMKENMKKLKAKIPKMFDEIFK